MTDVWYLEMARRKRARKQLKRQGWLRACIPSKLVLCSSTELAAWRVARYSK